MAYEHNKHFLNTWAMKFPWAEFVMGYDDKVVQIWCKVCTQIKGKKNLLIPKLDYAWKHVARLRSYAKGKSWEQLFLENQFNVANRKLYSTTSVETMLY